MRSEGVHFLLASHGQFARGIKSSMELILGPLEAVDTFCAYEEPGKDYREMAHAYLEKFPFDEQELVIFTDLLGGSVANDFIQWMPDYPFLLVTGMHLSLLLECYCSRKQLDRAALCQIVEDSRGSILCVSMENTTSTDDEF